MACIRLYVNDVTRDLVVPESCLVGRHWSCFARIDLESVPLYWVEIRWLGTNWAWRALNQSEDTRGSGAVGANGWRVLRPDPNRPPRVSIGEHAWLEFTDLSAPEAFAQNVDSHELIEGADLEDLWECFDGRIFRFGWEDGELSSAVLKDGDLLSHDGSLYRVFSPSLCPPTAIAPLQISMADCEVTIDLDNLEATFETSRSSAVIKGECVRVLAVYALPRRDEHYTDGGWLNSVESHSRWLALGGNPKSKPDRIGHERGKLRTKLNKAGVSDVQSLFERRSSSFRTTIRLGLAPEHIHVVGDELEDDL